MALLFDGAVVTAAVVAVTVVSVVAAFAATAPVTVIVAAVVFDATAPVTVVISSVAAATVFISSASFCVLEQIGLPWSGFFLGERREIVPCSNASGFFLGEQRVLPSSNA